MRRRGKRRRAQGFQARTATIDKTIYLPSTLRGVDEDSIAKLLVAYLGIEGYVGYAKRGMHSERDCVGWGDYYVEQTPIGWIDVHGPTRYGRPEPEYKVRMKLTLPIPADKSFEEFSRFVIARLREKS